MAKCASCGKEGIQHKLYDVFIQTASGRWIVDPTLSRRCICYECRENFPKSHRRAREVQMEDV